jgi:hypothetical protein
LIDQSFGDLKVIRLEDSKEKGRRYWLCQCSCGQKITCNTNQLRNGLITSCGHAEHSILSPGKIEGLSKITASKEVLEKIIQRIRGEINLGSDLLSVALLIVPLSN